MDTLEAPSASIRGRRLGSPLGWPGAGSWSIRSSLVLLVVACVLPAATVALLLIASSYRDGKLALFEYGRVTSRSIMRAVDGELLSAVSGLQALATSPALHTQDLAQFHAQAREVLHHLAGSNVVLSASDGQQLVNTLVEWGRPLPRHGNPALLRQVIEGGKPVVSDLFVGGVTRRPLVAVEVPVPIDGKPAHGLAMGIFPEKLAQILSGLSPDPDWVVSVVDRNGIIVARTHLPERFVGQNASPSLLAAMADSREGMIEAETLEGATVLAAFTHSSVSGWAVAVGIPKQALLSKLQQWALWLSVATSVFLGFGVATAVAVARRISRAIANLVPMADTLGRGEPVGESAPVMRETDAVAQALHRASDLLQRRTLERDQAARQSADFRRHAKRLEHEARHDPLTDLANRSKFLDALVQSLHTRAVEGGELTVFFVDLDDFKPVNDSYGHLVGDELLRDFAARLRSGVREGDLVARLGGDEFAVLLDGLGRDQASRIAEALIERLSTPYAIMGHEIHVTASVGAAGYPADGADAAALLDTADAAMYRAKHEGKGRFSASQHGALEPR